ncbi:hypothetical protein RT723_06235 [Psychrosphaera aquimarina]|uniref:Mur ligase C-terminal domain-containing protein n=1 Tax=Psychrosphaera aquimarina TaxID=2044854 RepID=A0ABU3QYV6_9GAMM|nr:hypothetical protein [Psychrosphaera aquimarina]MDU0112608.1 hypothetical protein [Psychrosphaera aquimarina]
MQTAHALTVKIKGEEIAVKLGAPGRSHHTKCYRSFGYVFAAWCRYGACGTRTWLILNLRRVAGNDHFDKLVLDILRSLTKVIMQIQPQCVQGFHCWQRAEPGRGGRRIAVLGDMLEMGEFSEKLHVELAQPLQEAGVDIVALSGKDMNYLADAIRGEMQVYYRTDLDALIEWLMSKVRSGDVIMVKSSLGIGFGKVVKKLQEKFPECEPDDDQLASGD